MWNQGRIAQYGQRVAFFAKLEGKYSSQGADDFAVRRIQPL